MKKRIIIILSISIVLILGTITALAAFVFTQNVNTTAKTGDITIEKEGYVSYALNQNVSLNDYSSVYYYQAALKERAGGTVVDTEAVDFKTYYLNYYTRSIAEASSYTSGTIYYIKDDTGNYVYAGDINSFLDDETYYTITYTKVTSQNYTETATQVTDLENFDTTKAYYKLEGGNYVYQNITSFASGVTYYTCKYTLNTSSTDKNYYRLGHEYDASASTYTGYFVLSGIDTAGYGIFQEATSYDASTRYYKITYTPKDLTADGLITNDSEDYGVSCVNTYGTERTGSLAETGSYVYLNQVGFEFEIKTKIECFVRIKFRDAWISSKLYKGSSTPIVRYTSKQTISGRSPFYVDDPNWYFDTVHNIAYLKTSMTAKDESYRYSFNLDPSYFYKETNTQFTEKMIIQVSYSLELIQANRVKTVWGIDPSLLS